MLGKPAALILLISLEKSAEIACSELIKTKIISKVNFFISITPIKGTNW
jgi:hypothetical protein